MGEPIVRGDDREAPDREAGHVTRDAGRPIWLADVDDPSGPGAPPETMPARVGVVVVGAGIAGCVAALLLARGGADVAVLDRRAPGRGATGRSAGFLLRGTADHPERVAGAIGRERALALWRYTAASIDELVALLEEEKIDCGLTREGSLVLAVDDDERRLLEASCALVAPCGSAGESWSDAEVERRTGFRGFTAGWFRPGDGVLDPARLCRGLAQAAERRGARVLSSVEVTGIDEGAPHAPLRVRTSRGDVLAERAVLAVNAALPRMDARFATVISPVRAQMLATAPLSGAERLRWPVYAHHGYEYWRHEPSGELLFGGCRWAAEPGHERGVSDDGGVSEVVFEAQRAFMARHLPAFSPLSVTRRWTGIMAFTPDGLPLVGAVPGSARQLVCAGWNGHGLALAPRSARLVASLILGAPVELPADFAPARF